MPLTNLSDHFLSAEGILTKLNQAQSDLDCIGTAVNKSSIGQKKTEKIKKIKKTSNAQTPTSINQPLLKKN